MRRLFTTICINNYNDDYDNALDLCSVALSRPPTVLAMSGDIAAVIVLRL